MYMVLDQKNIWALQILENGTIIKYGNCENIWIIVPFSTRETPDGLLIQFQELTWTLDGVHQDMWLSVTTSQVLCLWMDSGIQFGT
jgi:hypothetical protein